MKRFTTILCLVCALFTLPFQAQILKNYKFSDKQVEVPSVFEKSDAYYLERHFKSEIFKEKGNIVEYNLYHEKIKINSNLAIEWFNKYYIPYNSKSDLVLQKFRVINPDGVKELDKKDIKQEVNEDRGYTRDYFAVQDLKVGSIIESFYVVKKYPSFTGKSIQAQLKLPTCDFSIEIIHPDYFTMAFKSYNNLEEAHYDLEKYKGQKSLFLNAKNIDALPDDEKESNYDRHVQKFRFKMHANSSFGVTNMYNFTSITKNIFPYLTPDVSSSFKKDFETLLAKIEVKTTTADQIRSIEAQVKKQIEYDRYVDQNSLKEVFVSGKASQVNIIQLYSLLYQKFKIPFELVLTSDRFENDFDKDFESYDYLNDILFYFPSENKYMSPLLSHYRYPLFDETNAANYGLFIKERLFNNVKMPVHEVRYISFPEEILEDKMDIDVDFTQDSMNPKVKSKIQFGSYVATSLQPISDFMDKNNLKSTLDDIASNYTMNTKPTSVEIENGGAVNVGLKPFILHVETDGASMIQRAGKNILCNIGLVIGKQMELYQVKDRKLPVELHNPRFYVRNITVKLPAGYTPKNLNALNIDKRIVDENGKEVGNFTSSYTFEAGVIKIKNTEAYNFNILPVDRFEQYRSVVNAAADFSKINIILEKK